MNKYLSLALLWIFFTPAYSQTNVSMGFLPKVNISVELSNKLKLNNSVESRQVLLKSLENNFTHEVLLYDFSSVASYKTSAQTTVNGGYLLRLANGNAIHRTMQQFTYTTSNPALRFGHRFATDQNFTQQLPPEFRFRYRITLDKPLNGIRLDPNEFYLKASSEIIFATRSGASDIEFRMKPSIGFLLQTSNKFEFGIDYRFNEFVTSAIDHDFWISISWYKSIKRKKS